MEKGHHYSEYERITHHYVKGIKRPNRTSVQKIKQRLGCRCAICGDNRDYCIDLHHIVPLEYGGTNDISNFICLCKNCHAEQHYVMKVMLSMV